ncbi:MAG: serine/threonine-protein kinase [Planctomycetota bacterium]
MHQDEKLRGEEAEISGSCDLDTLVFDLTPPPEQDVESAELEASTFFDAKPVAAVEDDGVMMVAADGSRCGYIPGYSIIGRLGQGGMSVVFQAVQEKLQRIVALKVLTPNRCLDPEAVARFEIEARAVARLNHPNIVAAYDYGEADGRFFLALEYVEGINCAELIRAEESLAEDCALRIVRDAILGLSHALSLGVIHRDVKPANLMFAKGGVADASRVQSEIQVKVTDLGLAMMEETAQGAATSDRELAGCIAGTPSFMAPEQARGEVVDFRADIYSLGATLYQMVTGVRPYDAESAIASIKQKLEERLIHPLDLRPQLNPGLVRVLDRMMAFDRNRRYQTYEELLDDIEALLEGRWARTAELAPNCSSFLPSKLRPPMATSDSKASIHDERTEAIALPQLKKNSPSSIWPWLVGAANGLALGFILGKWI